MGNVSLAARPALNVLPHSSEAPETEKEEPAPKEPAPKSRILGKLLGIVLIACAFGAGWMLAKRNISDQAKETLPAETGAAPHNPAAVVVTVEPVTLRSVQRAVEGVGTLHGFEEVLIAARVEGRVRKLSFDVADHVKPGELLLEIDPIDYELAVVQAERALQVELAKLGLNKLTDSDVDLETVPSVMQAKTRMENAQLRHERVRKLLASRAISTEEADTAASDFRAAQAEHAHQLLMARSTLATIQMKQSALAIAQQQLKDTQVRVPTPTLPIPGAADGMAYAVTQRSVSEGTLVRPGTEIGMLVINQTLKLRMPVPERFTAEVRVGQSAEVKTAGFSKPFAGKVTRINPAVDPATRAFEVEVQVPNPTGELKPGSFAKAAIQTRRDAETATVPLAALVNFAGINKIFLVENGRAKEMQVTLGVETTEWAEIASPALPRDAVVITSGQSVLAADSPVTVREAKDLATSANAP